SDLVRNRQSRRGVAAVQRAAVSRERGIDLLRVADRPPAKDLDRAVAVGQTDTIDLTRHRDRAQRRTRRRFETAAQLVQRPTVLELLRGSPPYEDAGRVGGAQGFAVPNEPPKSRRVVLPRENEGKHSS